MATVQLSRQILLTVGFEIIRLVNEQISKGVDEDGKKYAYSTKPFARPVGGSKLKRVASLEKEGKLQRFRTKEGKLWMVVTGGYRSLREMQGLNPDGDFLQVTGQMLRSMVPKVAGGEVVISFSDARSARLAFYFTVSGVGKSRRLWKFLGLNEASKQDLTETVGALITQDALKSLNINNA
ncbi:MAG: hypothetical protein JNL32_02975 [Candidatus Kapabacteria bacterium]|nr:hypothetical protein [Candidatus Kapabacteria bacterium]